MPISAAAMEENLELSMDDGRPGGVPEEFGGGGYVVKVGEQRHVYVRGTLVGSFGPKDTAMRNLLMVGLATGEKVHLERLAAAFGYSADGLRRIRRLYEEKGELAVAQRRYQGGKSKLTPAMRQKMEAVFARGASLDEAWETLGKKLKVSRSTVGALKQAWRKAQLQEASPKLALALVKGGTTEEANSVPPRSSSSACESATEKAAEASSTPALALSVAPESNAVEEAAEMLKPTAVESAPAVQHLGSWLLVAMAARLGLYAAAAKAAEGRHSTEALRIALDAVVMALAVGERCVEGVRRLATSTAATLVMATGMPSPTWTRRVLGGFAADGGGPRLHLALAGEYMREAQASATARGPVFYVDNHLRPYTGKHVIRRGWRMQDKRVRPGTSDYYVHDEDGRPVMRTTAPEHGSLTDWLHPIASLLRLALGDEETILLAFDRGGAFPEQMVALREDGFEFVTYERKPYPALPESAFTETVTLDDETYRVFDTRKNLGDGRGRLRRIAARLPDGHQLNLLANSKRSPAELLEVMSGRWRQENAFKHGVERWGINQLDGRTVQPYDPDTIIPNPARRRLDRAIRIARAREGAARAELARLEPHDGAERPTALNRDIAAAVLEQIHLEAQRPSTPPRAALRDTELAGKLVRHTVEYKLTLDTIRIACANAESDLAGILAPHLPKPAEAKKTLANLFAAPGSLKVGKRTIDVCLDVACTRPERLAFDHLFEALNRLGLTMPGDQHDRPLRLISPRN